MMNTNHASELNAFLKNCIQTIKEKSPHLSSNAISNRLRISSSSFSRIENLEVKSPSLDHALKIVRAVCDNHQVKDFVKKYYPSLLNNFQNVYPDNSDVAFVGLEAESYFEDPATYEMMMLATSAAGLTKEQAQREFGTRGLITLEKLIEKEILTDKNGIVSNNSMINASQETVQKLFINLIKLSYNPESFDSANKSWLSVQYESVNKELALPELSKIIHDTNQRIRTLLTETRMKGNDVVWAGIAVDTLPTTPPDTNGVIQ